ncbi:MAG: peptidoglycan D,D-transpeptidase FtsI family protein [Acidimicrobiales bacterium]
MPKHRRPGNPRRRLIGLLLVVVLLFVVIIGRTAQLQLFEGGRYAQIGESQRVHPVTLPAERGSVFDRDGNDLALSVPQKTVWADPRLVTDPQGTAQVLAPVLGVDVATLTAKLVTPGAFVYLARQVTDDVATKVAALRREGVELLDESKRFLPSGTLARSLLGTVDTDNKGIAGLESQYDTTLTGTPGQLVYERDPTGRTIAAGEHRIDPARPGDDLILTIDQALQFETEQALADKISEMGAKGGTAIVADPRTGEILAMANMEAQSGGSPIASTNNKALTTVYEPGSASKVITLAAALEEQVASPSTELTVPDHLQVSDGLFTDHDPHPTEQMNLTDIMATSSNIGTIMLGRGLGAERLDAYQRKFGYGSPTSLGFPNESPGLMLPLRDWSGTSIGTIPIGQGVAVTALQMLQAFNVIADGGRYVDPKLVLDTVDSNGTRHPTATSAAREVVSEKTAGEVRDMMTAVVNAGTGKQAAIAGYSVAGKTGTARKPQRNGGYVDAAGNPHYVTTFAGFVPAEDPRISAIVVLDEPTKDIYASDTAAPVFSRIASYALRRFQIAPPQALRSTVPAPRLTEPDRSSSATDPDVKVRSAAAEVVTTTPAPTTTSPRSGSPPTTAKTGP